MELPDNNKTRPILEYGVQVWQDIPEILSNKLESIQKRALHIIFPCLSYLDALNTTSFSSLKKKDELSSAVNIFIRKMSQNDQPINFLIPKTATSGHSNNLRPGDNNKKYCLCWYRSFCLDSAFRFLFLIR